MSKLTIEDILHLNKFQPRHYQIKSCLAFESGKYRKFLDIEARRSGKDYKWFMLMIRAAIKTVGLYLYCLPTYSQCKSVIWEGKSNSGAGFLDAIPPNMISKIRNDTMTINLINGSIIRLVGSDSYNNSIIGSNPIGIVFSEYALCDENAYKLGAMPIMKANDGWVALISTPRGKNHMYELYQIAKNNPDEWFTEFLTIEDTGHISVHEIRKEIETGEISEDLAQQEYFCSFEMGQEGSIYNKYIDKMRLKGQIGSVPWEPYHKVHTAWDLGIKDPTVIIFFQVVGEIVRIIDYYEASDKGMDHFANVLANKQYSYGYHFPPHDIMVREQSRGMSRREMYAELGVKFTEPVVIGIEDGIETVRRTFSKIWIDDKNCSKLIKALENYREEFDIKRKVYKGRPLHDWASHACFTGDTAILTRSGMRQIMDIEENDEVLTLCGWKKCTKAQRTKTNVEVVQVTFRDGTMVKCTPDHLFLTAKGWKSAQSLTRGTVIQSFLMNSLNILKDLYIDFGRMKDIFLREAKDCTERSGSGLLEQFLLEITYTTETIIPLITTSGTWNASQKKIILSCLDQTTKDLVSLLGMRQRLGTRLWKGDCGIVGTPHEFPHGLNGKGFQETVFSAINNLTALFGEMDMNKNFVIPTVRQLTIEGVKYVKDHKGLNKLFDVYDITVPEVGHFSLANSTIVHNSDCMRYLCAALPKTKDSLSAEKLERIYQEAMGGSRNANMPSVFRDDLPEY